MTEGRRSLVRVGALVALVAGSMAPLTARAADIPFTIALVTGPASPQNVVAKEVAAQIAKDTGGRVAAKVFESGQLGQTDALLQAMITGGGVQATVTVVTDTICPPTKLFLAPYAFKDRITAYAALDGAAAQPIYAECSKKGYDFVAAWDSGFRQLSTNKPVNSLADLQRPQGPRAERRLVDRHVPQSRRQPDADGHRRAL